MEEIQELLNHIDAIYLISSKLASWSLSILGGTVILVISNSFFQINNTYLRFSYFIFIPGWLLLLFSIYQSTLIDRRIPMTKLYSGLKPDDIDKINEIAKLCNEHYSIQIKFFIYSLICLSIWLIIFLIWKTICSKN